MAMSKFIAVYVLFVGLQPTNQRFFRRISSVKRFVKTVTLVVLDLVTFPLIQHATLLLTTGTLQDTHKEQISLG